ncbi:MAG: hypothetical protein B7Z68_00690 [Acidobacteria bacterium 21-70-11]|nr:MAG: hypothetical protein B7Z68_00690 [Acidobacteria bacterium 21-70-11]
MVPVTGLAAFQKLLAERSLYEFVKLMWHVVEPATPMTEGRVLEAICRHLEAVVDGDIKRLIINVPPGASKSLITCCFFPAWVWGPQNIPAARFITAAYTVTLTERDNERCSRIMTSPLYLSLWGDRVHLTKTGVSQIATSGTGWKLATSVEGVSTGARADYFIIDDANSVKQAESKAIRDGTNLWLTEVVPTRLNNPSESAIINIQQRTHEQDATGTLIEAWTEYDHLMLPMVYDPDRHCETSIGFSDWRSEEGELLWPERFPPAVVEGYKRMGPYAWASQFQQSPVTRGGGLVLREWWQEWLPKETPPFEFVLASLDTAIKDKEENDYYALTLWGVWRDPDTGTPRLFLLYAWKRRAPLAAIVVDVVTTCRRFRVDQLLIEDKAHGHIAQEEIRRMSNGWKFGIAMFDPRRYGDKTARLLSIQHLFSEGLVYAPVVEDEFGNVNWRTWADEVITEIANFPRAKHDDLTDSSSMALRYLRDIGFALRKEEHADDERNRATFRPKSKALYPV